MRRLALGVAFAFALCLSASAQFNPPIGPGSIGQIGPSSISSGSGGGGTAPTVLADFTTGALGANASLTRSTAATYYNSSGVQTTAGVDVPRFDYDPNTLALKGLKISNFTINSVVQSNFASGWATTAATKTLNAGTSPDGTSDAVSLTETAANSVHNLTPTAVWTLAAATGGYEAACNIKQSVGSRNVLIIIAPNIVSNTNGAFAIVNPSTGAIVTAASVYGNFIAAQTSVQNLGNGWFRVYLGASAGTNKSSSAAIELAMTNGTTQSYVGDGTSKVLINQCDLRQSDVTALSEPIPTTTAAVTQSYDILTLSNIPAGQHQLTFTFDDNSTQTLIAPTGSTYQVPVMLNRPWIKKVTASNYSGPACPALATAAGFSTTTLSENWNSSATIDTGQTNAPGFTWYPSNLMYQGAQWLFNGINGTNTASVAVAGNVMTLDNGGGLGTWGLHTSAVAPTTTTLPVQMLPPFITGTPLKQGGYFAWTAKVDQSQRMTGEMIWPVVWLWGQVGTLYQSFNNSGWEWGEIDFFEYQPPPATAVGDYAAHDWTSPSTNSTHVFTYTPDNNYHLFETVWQTQAQSGGLGVIKWYQDGVLVGTQNYSSGAIASPAITPSNPVGALSTLDAFGNEMMAFITGATTTSQPINVKAVQFCQ